MIEEYWQLQFNPFQNLVSDRWYYDSPMHQETLSRLYYVVEQRQKCGIFTGAAGAGKSLLLELLRKQAKRTQRQVALLDVYGMEGAEVLSAVIGELGLGNHPHSSRTELWRMLTDHLHGSTISHQQVVLLFDHLSHASLEAQQYIERMLHLPACTKGWITTIVAARPEEIKELPAGILGQVDLRIALDSLDGWHTAEYVRQALKFAGANRALFANATMHHLFESSHGNPQQINQLCHLALLGAIEAEADEIGPELFVRCAEELVV